MADDTLIIENANIMFRNFAGAAKQFNDEGQRNFCVFLQTDQAEKLRSEGWNVKSLRPREEEDEPQQYIQVSVSYGKGRPPRCVLMTSRGRQDLGSDEVAMLDWADIKKADIIIRPYNWEVNGNKGTKAYLKSIFVTLNEDELELKYADVQDATPPSSQGEED